LFLKCLVASSLTLFGLSTLLFFGSCNHCNLAWFLFFLIIQRHSLSNHGLCWFNCYKLPLAEDLIVSLMFSKTLFMALLSFNCSKAADYFEISICYRFLTSSSLSYLTLKLSKSHFWAAYLLTANLAVSFATTR